MSKKSIKNNTPLKVLSTAALIGIGTVAVGHGHEAHAATGSAPTIHAPNQQVEYGSKWNPYEGVTANDKEDGDLSKEVYYDAPYFTTTQPGTYHVKYGVWDMDDNNTETNRNVTVLRQGVNPSNGNDQGNTTKPKPATPSNNTDNNTNTEKPKPSQPTKPSTDESNNSNNGTNTTQPSHSDQEKPNQPAKPSNPSGATNAGATTDNEPSTPNTNIPHAQNNPSDANTSNDNHTTKPASPNTQPSNEANQNGQNGNEAKPNTNNTVDPNYNHDAQGNAINSNESQSNATSPQANVPHDVNNSNHKQTKGNDMTLPNQNAKQQGQTEGKAPVHPDHSQDHAGIHDNTPKAPSQITHNANEDAAKQAIGQQSNQKQQPSQITKNKNEDAAKQAIAEHGEQTVQHHQEPKTESQNQDVKSNYVQPKSHQVDQLDRTQPKVATSNKVQDNKVDDTKAKANENGHELPDTGDTSNTGVETGVIASILGGLALMFGLKRRQSKEN